MSDPVLKETAPARVFWAASAGGLAAVLLLAGGLEALQTAVIASALPFTVVMVFICLGVLRALQLEGYGDGADLSQLTDAPADPELSWRQRLTSITHFFTRAEIADFLAGTARPALASVAAEMEQSGLSPELVEDEEHIDLKIPHGDRGEFRYTIRRRAFRSPSFVWAETDVPDDAEWRHYRAMAHSSEGEQPHDVTGYTRA